MTKLFVDYAATIWPDIARLKRRSFSHGSKRSTPIRLSWLKSEGYIRFKQWIDYRTAKRIRQGDTSAGAFYELLERCGDKLMTTAQVQQRMGIDESRWKRLKKQYGEEFPKPDKKGGGPKPNQWYWSNIAPFLRRALNRSE